MLAPNGRRSVRIRAASITPAMPLALSFAPGASVVASVPDEARESMSPLMTTYRSGSTSPRRTAITLTIITSSGIRDSGSPSTTVRW